MYKLSGFDVWRDFQMIGLDVDEYEKLESRFRYLADEVSDAALVDQTDPHFDEVELALSIYYSPSEPRAPTPWLIHTCAISNAVGEVPEWFGRLFPSQEKLHPTVAAMRGNRLCR